MMKIINIIFFMVLTCFISACKDSNPLNNLPVKDVANALSEASKTASISVGLNRAGAEDNYRQCMRSKHKQTLCRKLKVAMKHELQKQGLDVTISNLNDPKMYKRVSERLDFLSHLTD